MSLESWIQSIDDRGHRAIMAAGDAFGEMLKGMFNWLGEKAVALGVAASSIPTKVADKMHTTATPTPDMLPVSKRKELELAQAPERAVGMQMSPSVVQSIPKDIGLKLQVADEGLQENSYSRPPSTAMNSAAVQRYAMAR